MKATFYFTEEDIKAMLLERWGPRTDIYHSDGPEERKRIRITQLSFYSSGGWVEFSNEPEETTPLPPPTKSPDDDIVEF